MLFYDPVNRGANVAKWILKNKENLPCQLLWAKENCLLLEDHHQRKLIVNIPKDKIVVFSLAAKNSLRIDCNKYSVFRIRHASHR